ncbi:hypothetical protein AWL63_15340 [Sphingomonas panacis]|uniref:Uncharacterized protein n=2 Tax=Sphingomonas panacis TaxID=1560345 RepID=A0A1B3ZCI3_9SPHN|nr:hypothetical protein AWL63_15340 [Sphingomonas panacis]
MSNLHPNDVKVFAPTTEQLDLMLARSVERAAAEREARIRAEAWPRDVEDMLTTLAAKALAFEARLAALEAERG